MMDFMHQLKQLHVLKTSFEAQQSESQLLDRPDHTQLTDFLESEKNNVYSEFGNSALEIHNNIVLLYKQLGWI